MTTKTKILIGILGILVFVGAVFGAYKLGQKQIQPAPQPTPTPEIVATPTPDPTANWETYMNTTLGYSVKYPSGWEVKILKNAVSIVDPCGKQICDSVWISDTVDQNDPVFKEAKQKRSVKVRKLETYQTVRPSSDGLATLKYFYFEKNEEWWLIQFTQTNEKAGITFNLMLSTFRFLEGEGDIKSQGECKSLGGKWTYHRAHALDPKFAYCVLPTSDTGQSCTNNSQCESGLCVVESQDSTSGTCYEWSSAIGWCGLALVEENKVKSYCID